MSKYYVDDSDDSDSSDSHETRAPTASALPTIAPDTPASSEKSSKESSDEEPESSDESSEHPAIKSVAKPQPTPPSESSSEDSNLTGSGSDEEESPRSTPLKSTSQSSESKTHTTSQSSESKTQPTSQSSESKTQSTSQSSESKTHTTTKPSSESESEPEPESEPESEFLAPSYSEDENATEKTAGQRNSMSLRSEARPPPNIEAEAAERSLKESTNDGAAIQGTKSNAITNDKEAFQIPLESAKRPTTADQANHPHSARGQTGNIRALIAMAKESQSHEADENLGATPSKVQPDKDSDIENDHPISVSDHIAKELRANPDLEHKSFLWTSIDKKKCGAYFGTMHSHQKHGYGVYTWDDGREYRGQWVDDLMEGDGIYIWLRQPPSENPIKKEVPGPINMSNVKSMYKGEFKAGKMNGTGFYRMEDGSEYKGEWVDDEMCGQGTLTGADKSVFKGEFLHDLPHGKGTKKFADQSTYDGDWQAGLPHGRGVYIWNDGEAEYQGDFVSGLFEGHGKMTWRKRVGKQVRLNQYEGGWRQGVRDGAGKYMWADGTVCEGVWERGRMSRGRCRFRHPDGSVTQF